MYYYPIAGEFTTRNDGGNEEKDIFSIEVDGDVKVGHVKIRPVNDAPVPDEPGQLAFPRFGEPALLARGRRRRRYLPPLQLITSGVIIARLTTHRDPLNCGMTRCSGAS